MRMKSFIFMGVLVALLNPAQAALTGLWQFDGNLNAQQGSALTFRGSAAGKSTFDTTTNFAIPNINGVAAQVMKWNAYANTDGLTVNGNLAANGGGAKVNQYTIVMDLLPTVGEAPTPPPTYYSILETNLAANDADAEFFIQDNDNNPATRDTFGAGTPLGGYLSPKYVPGDWFRLTISVDAVRKSCMIYMNGDFVGALGGGSLGSTTAGVGGVDGRFGLTPGLANMLLFVNPTTGWAGTGYINSLAVYDGVLAPEQVQALGGPKATGLPATIPTVTAPVEVLNSDFNEAVATNPITTGDVSNRWAVDTTFHGSFGWVDYNGAGQLVLNHMAAHYSDPWIEVTTTPTLQVSDDFDAEFVLNPKFTTTALNDQSIVLQLTNTASNDDQPDAFTKADTDVFVKVRNDQGTAKLYFSDDPAAPGLGQEISTPADQISTLTLRMTYQADARLFKVYYKVNDGVWYAYRFGSISLTRTKSVFRLTAETSFGYAVYDSFQILVDNIMVSQGVGPLVEGTVMRESTFNLPEDLTNPFDPLLGELDQMYAVSSTMEFNGTGQLVVHRNANSAAYPNSTINGRLHPDQSASWRLDLDPDFTTGGYGQNVNLLTSYPNASIRLLNNVGATTPSLRVWGIQFGSSNFFSPQGNEFLNLQPYFPVEQVTSLSLLLTYNNPTQTWHLYYNVNNVGWREHPAGAVVLARSSTAFQFQYFVTSAANTEPYEIKLDNYQEILGDLSSPVQPSAASHWSLY